MFFFVLYDVLKCNSTSYNMMIDKIMKCFQLIVSLVIFIFNLRVCFFIFFFIEAINFAFDSKTDFNIEILLYFEYIVSGFSVSYFPLFQMSFHSFVKLITSSIRIYNILYIQYINFIQVAFTSTIHVVGLGFQSFQSYIFLIFF